jgi:hypothetical protein
VSALAAAIEAVAHDDRCRAGHVEDGGGAVDREAGSPDDLLETPDPAGRPDRRRQQPHRNAFVASPGPIEQPVRHGAPNGDRRIPGIVKRHDEPSVGSEDPAQLAKGIPDLVDRAQVVER